jgi:hypothetical protein
VGLHDGPKMAEVEPSSYFRDLEAMRDGIPSLGNSSTTPYEQSHKLPSLGTYIVLIQLSLA